MWKLGIWVLLAAAIGGGWYVYSQYDVRGLDQIRIVPKGQDKGQPAAAPQAEVAPPPAAPSRPLAREVLRVASFNLSGFDERKLSVARTREIVAQAIGRFDLVALQDLRARNQGVLIRLVEQASAAGKKFDFATASNAPPDAVEPFGAFVFDKAMIDVDRAMVYTVQDPTNLFRRKPLVGVFRAKGPKEQEAFTFTLINVDLDPQQTTQEIDALLTAYRAVRDDGRAEDDVLVAGSIHADAAQLAQLERLFDITGPVSNTPTTTRGTKISDNVLFNRRATAEFTGRWGVIDLIREFSLTMQEALEISEHLPVWAEFSVYEGGRPGHIVAEPRPAGR